MKSIKKLIKKRPILTEHIVYTNDPEANKPFHYPKNKISTTKYTLVTFPIKFIYEQFRKLPYLYFLLVAIITCIPNISPISPVSAVLPFLLIILTAAVKEAFEDFRWQSDREINSRTYDVLSNDTFTLVENKDIQVGDIIHLTENQEVPADIVIISTSEKEGICYVDTANLDGETNLKLFKSLPETSIMTEEEIVKLKAKITSQPPNEKLYDFKANMVQAPMGQVLDNPLTPVSQELLSLGKLQLLMRGVRIRNTKHVYGIVVFTGKNTKLALNAVEPSSKFSQTDHTINYACGGLFIVYLILVTACAIASNILEANNYYWYNPVTTSVAADGGIVWMSYFVLLGYFIPISLFVNLEILKLVQAGWMMADEDMTLESKGMRVKNSNLNDELSRVSYIFSDKTGTLTQNKMVFDQCSIAGIKYTSAGRGELKDFVARTPAVREFLLNMTLNNEVLPEDKGDIMPKYAAPSPDEIALVKGAFLNGVQFRKRTNEGISIFFESTDELLTFEILNVFEFSSVRKRSSVIVRTPDDGYVMYTKGADSVMKERLSPNNSKSAVTKTEEHLTEYSKEGLRALIFARKNLSRDEFKNFNQKYQNAASSLDDREGKLEKLMNEIEQDLDLIGCSAIQDALQERVPFTIAYLIRAGIKVWMITGDQQDTAENIGHSCKLVTRESRIVRVVKCDTSDKCKEDLTYAEKIVKSTPKVSLVIDGQSLVYALSSYSYLLLNVAKDCETVIVCRADPLQKALVVRLMKRGTKKICLSIGDGANDVSMLQEAHIGVGIWGEEGSQAANNADYAIRRFKHLAKLVTVHGRYSMLRTAILVEYSFYKNLAMFVGQFWFSFYCLFSGQTYFDDWVMTAYNVVIVSLPPLSLGIFEKDLIEKIILKYPETYREVQKGLYLTYKTFLRWMFTSTYHSIIIFFSIFFLSGIMSSNGQNIDLEVLSTITVNAGVFAIVMKAAVVTKHWVWPSVVAYLLSLIALFVLLLFENSLVDLFPDYYNVMITAMSLPSFWLMILIVVALCTVPEICIEFSQRMCCPYNWQIIQEQYIEVDEDSYVDEAYTEIEMAVRKSTLPTGDLDPMMLNPRSQGVVIPDLVLGNLEKEKSHNVKKTLSYHKDSLVNLSPRIIEEDDKGKGHDFNKSQSLSHRDTVTLSVNSQEIQDEVHGTPDKEIK